VQNDKELVIVLLLDPIQDDEPIIRVFDSEDEANEFIDRCTEYLNKKLKLESKESDIELCKKTCILGQKDLETVYKFLDDHMFDSIDFDKDENEISNTSIEDEVY